MPPTLITSYAVYSAAADNTTLTTPSFTPANGEVIIVKLATWDTGNGMAAPTGGTQTYTAAGIAAPGGFNAWCAVYTATVSGSPGAMTISSAPATGSNTRHSMIVERWSGAALAGSPATNATKNGSGTTATTTLTTVGANSVVSWVMVDENSRDPLNSTYASSATEDGLYNGFNGSQSVQYFAYQSAASAGSQTFGVTNTASVLWVAVGVEIKAGSTSSSATASDTITITDAATRTLALPRATGDTITVSDSAARTVATARAAGDTIAITDTATAHVTLARAAADTVNISDTASRALLLARNSADTITATDTATRTIHLARAAADAVTITDHASPPIPAPPLPELAATLQPTGRLTATIEPTGRLTGIISEEP